MKNITSRGEPLVLSGTAACGCAEAPNVSQCHTLAEAAEEMRPLIADRAGLDERDVEIDVRVAVPDVIQDALSEASQLREE